VKSGGGVTTSESVIVWVSVPLTPVTVSGYVPIATLPDVVTARLEEAAVGFGVKVPAAPLGSPLTLIETWPLKPPV
jgi:hypothetical protein